MKGRISTEPEFRVLRGTGMLPVKDRTGYPHEEGRKKRSGFNPADYLLVKGIRGFFSPGFDHDPDKRFRT